VKLRSVLIKAGPGGQTPSNVALVCLFHPLYFLGCALTSTQFANEDTLDFNDVADRKATQEFAIVQSREIGDYAVK
jgi:hypothetical protein